MTNLQSPPKGATIPYRPKPQVGGPVILAGGQAYTIQGNYAVPATPDVSNSSSGCSAAATAFGCSAAVAAAVAGADALLMSSSLSPTSSPHPTSSSTSAHLTFPNQSSSSSCSSSFMSSTSTSLLSTTSSLSPPPPSYHHHNHHPPSLGGCCSVPRFPAGMGLSMMHSHDFCSPYTPTPSNATCPMMGFGHHQSVPAMQQAAAAAAAAMVAAASCTSHTAPAMTTYSSSPMTPTPLSLCSSSISSPTSAGYPTFVPWLSNQHQQHHQHHPSHHHLHHHQQQQASAMSPFYAVAPANAMTNTPTSTACTIHPSKNGTISLAAVSVPLSFYLGASGGGGGGGGIGGVGVGSNGSDGGFGPDGNGGGDGTGRVMNAPPHASSAAYSAFSASPVHMDVSLFLWRTHTTSWTPSLHYHRPEYPPLPPPSLPHRSSIPLRFRLSLLLLFFFSIKHFVQLF